jgi:hypothetical protein
VAFQIHLYAGLGIAIMMVAMGISGSAIAVREPIQFALHRPVKGNNENPVGVSIDRSLRTFQASHPDKIVATIQGFDRTDGVLALQTKAKAGGPDRFFFIDRKTGLQILSHERLSAVFDYLDDFHRNLLSGHKGRAINGFVAVLFCLTTLTGAVVWWPGASRWTRGLFIHLNLSWKRINYDLHSAAGFYCYLFLLLMSVTAVVLATPSIPDLFASGKSGGEQHHHHVHGGSQPESPSPLKGRVEHPTHREHGPTAPAADSRNGVDALLAALPGIVQSSGEQLKAIELDDSGIPSRLELARGEKTVIAVWDATSQSITSEQQTRKHHDRRLSLALPS